jgi:hypothetical protein
MFVTIQGRKPFGAFMTREGKTHSLILEIKKKMFAPARATFCYLSKTIERLTSWLAAVGPLGTPVHSGTRSIAA